MKHDLMQWLDEQISDLTEKRRAAQTSPYGSLRTVGILDGKVDLCIQVKGWLQEWSKAFERKPEDPNDPPKNCLNCKLFEDCTTSMADPSYACEMFQWSDERTLDEAQAAFGRVRKAIKDLEGLSFDEKPWGGQDGVEFAVNHLKSVLEAKTPSPRAPPPAGMHLGYEAIVHYPRNDDSHHTSAACDENIREGTFCRDTFLVTCPACRTVLLRGPR